MKRKWAPLTKLAQVGAVQHGTPIWESHLEKHGAEPSAIASPRGSLQATVPLVPVHSQHGILSFPYTNCCFKKKWSLSYAINIHIVTLTFLMSLGRKYFHSEPVILRIVWAYLSCELLGPSLYLNPPRAHLVELGVNNWSPNCTNKEGHFSEDKGSLYSPVFICGPNNIIPSFFRCCNCLKSQCPKGN